MAVTQEHFPPSPTPEVTKPSEEEEEREGDSSSEDKEGTPEHLAGEGTEETQQHVVEKKESTPVATAATKGRKGEEEKGSKLSESAIEQMLEGVCVCMCVVCVCV